MVNFDSFEIKIFENNLIVLTKFSGMAERTVRVLRFVVLWNGNSVVRTPRVPPGFVPPCGHGASEGSSSY